MSYLGDEECHECGGEDELVLIKGTADDPELILCLDCMDDQGAMPGADDMGWGD